MKEDVQARIHKQFRQTLDSMYPDVKSITQKTLKLNEKLMQIMIDERKKKT